MDEVLLVTGRSLLVEQVRRLAAAAGARLEVVAGAAGAGSAWRRARAVLLGDDAAALGVPVRRPGVLLLAPSATAGPHLWRTAVEVGAGGVALLPDDEAAVAAVLVAAAEGPGVSGRLVGLVPGCGGAGASVLAAAVARTARPRRALLVDADPLGGGLEALVGAQDEPGLRWPDLLDARAPVRAAALRDGLPRGDGGLPVLGWGTADRAVDGPTGPAAGLEAVPAEAVEAVVGAAARASELVVVDLPRSTGPTATALLWQLDLLVVVVPAHPRAAAAAQALLPALVGRSGDVRLVVTTRPGAPLAADDVADALALPLVGTAPADRDVRGALARGEPLPRPRGALARCARAVVDAVHEDGAEDGSEGGGGPAGRSAR